MSPRAGARRTTPRAGQLPELPAPISGESRKDREAGVWAPGTGMLPVPRRAVPAAQTLLQPGLGGSRLPSQAAGDRRRLRAGPQAQASQPIPDREKRSRGSHCAVEYRRSSTGRRACLRSQLRSTSPLPPRPSAPFPTPSPGCHRQPGSAGLGPMRAVRRLRALGRGRAGAAPGWGA